MRITLPCHVDGEDEMLIDPDTSIPNILQISISENGSTSAVFINPDQLRRALLFIEGETDGS